MVSILDIVLATAMKSVDERQKESIRNTIIKVMHFMQSFSAGDLAQSIDALKDLLFLIPIGDGASWAFSPIGEFVLKSLEIVAMILNGSANLSEITEVLADCLVLVSVPKGKKACTPGRQA